MPKTRKTTGEEGAGQGFMEISVYGTPRQLLSPELFEEAVRAYLTATCDVMMPFADEGDGAFEHWGRELLAAMPHRLAYDADVRPVENTGRFTLADATDDDARVSTTWLATGGRVANIFWGASDSSFATNDLFLDYFPLVGHTAVALEGVGEAGGSIVGNYRTWEGFYRDTGTSPGLLVAIGVAKVVADAWGIPLSTT